MREIATEHKHTRTGLQFQLFQVEVDQKAKGQMLGAGVDLAVTAADLEFPIADWGWFIAKRKRINPTNESRQSNPEKPPVG
ncbi:hypothetical protein [Meiothermus sp. CFH 77666]|uniref:hypothetical protein n=1 Tax=Meiothermus sp. CFH 77666 TaxID=2817942 RepID=UPI001AA065EF|nr:hypothetical protein [Meiothermus sp. CFH 77666]MBO1437984.1 hypothetical protein [Meiothermus sp. CFH 77666]